MSTKKEESPLKRLLNVQAQLHAPKNQKNKFGGYSYRSCEDILEALKKPLSENGLVLIVNDKIVEKESGRTYVEATATIYDVNSDWNISSCALAREPENKKGMDESQITGASSSYARKYALNGLFCIDDNKDADFTNRGDDGQQSRTAYQKPKVVKKEERNLNKEITVLFNKLDDDQKDAIKKTQKSVKEMDDKEKEEFIGYLNELKAS